MSEPQVQEVNRTPRGLIFLLAVACGVIVANIYYAQPLAGPIGVSLGMDVSQAGLCVTLTQIGYGLGLLFVVPLGDLLETRKLVMAALCVATLALLGAATASSPAAFLAASLVVGISSTAVQVLVPYAAALAAPQVRGRVVGVVMSGLLVGIMLARPVASVFDDLWGWRSIFYFGAAMMATIGMALQRALPTRKPEGGTPYGALLRSMAHLYRTTPVLQRRALYQTLLFGAFTLFWTTSPLLLAGPAFHMSQRGIALFALAGVAGAFAAPLAGRMGDRGWSRAATGVAIGSVLAGFGVAWWLARDGMPASGHGQGARWALALLTAAAILLDFGVQASLVIGQRAIYTLGAEVRSRLNGLFMATFFAGGAAASGVGAWAYARGGWKLACEIGLALPGLALLYFLTDRRDRERTFTP